MFPYKPEFPRTDIAVCEEAIRVGSHSFHAASKLLPAYVRAPALALYAFCRVADDAVDLGEEKQASVDDLRERLFRIYAGRPDARPSDRGMAWVVERYDLPRVLPEALIEGLAWDAEERRYRTLSDMTAYAARVAGSVGAMMALLMGARGAGQLARACDLGVAMQFTNIARDVGEDACAGRVYLPLDWFAEEGIDPDRFLAERRATSGIRRMTRRLLAEAEVLYKRSDPGILSLPASCRPAILAARHIYAAIGVEIARNDYDNVTRRAATTRGRKVALAALAVLRCGMPLPRRALDDLPLEQCIFLVAAASRPKRPRTLTEQADWMIAFMMERERRDRELSRAG